MLEERGADMSARLAVSRPLNTLRLANRRAAAASKSGGAAFRRGGGEPGAGAALGFRDLAGGHLVGDVGSAMLGLD